VGHFITWDCDVFCSGYIMYPIWIKLLFVTGGLGITSDLSGKGALDRVLKKISVVIPHFLPVKWLLCW
jgi:hypothetical protein